MNHGPMYVESIWLTPQSDEVPVPIISAKVLGGLKDYVRWFLTFDGPVVEWGWRLHHTAICIWEDRPDTP